MSIHVVDITTGRPATGMKVEVYAVDGGERLLASATVDPRGLVDDERLLDLLPAGRFEARFFVSDYFCSSRRAADTAPRHRPFLNVVSYPFGIADPERHYHLPFKTSPWGFSCFLGA
jgi:5-hydroxyisourate hydrolase-like protein (transthyretin family)